MSELDFNSLSVSITNKLSRLITICDLYILKCNNQSDLDKWVDARKFFATKMQSISSINSSDTIGDEARRNQLLAEAHTQISEMDKHITILPIMINNTTHGIW